MSKFHINKQGVSAPCKATKGNCPFGGSESHFDTIEEAQIEADRRGEQEFAMLPSVNQGVPKIQMPEKEFDNFKQQFLKETHLSEATIFEPREYAIVEIGEEEYIDSNEEKAYKSFEQHIPEDIKNNFINNVDGVIITDEQGVDELFEELYEKRGVDTWEYKHQDMTKSELEQIKKEIKNNPAVLINGESLYQVDYIERDSFQRNANKQDYYDPTFTITTGTRMEDVQVATEFKVEVDKIKKEIQDSYLQKGTGIPKLTSEEIEYMNENGYAPESDKISEYIKNKNDEIYGQGAKYDSTYTYLDEERDYGDNTKESIAIAKKQDERYFAAKKIIDEIYDKEIYNNDKWLTLDKETKASWDDYEDVKLTDKQSQAVAAEIIFYDGLDKLM